MSFREKLPEMLYWRLALPLKRAKRLFGPITAKCQVRGQEILLKISSDIEQYRADSFTTKEPETLDWIDQHLNEQSVLFDVGANVGLYTLYAAKKYPRSKVYAFEPESQNYAKLCFNIFQNQLKNVVPMSLAVSESKKISTFFASTMVSGSAMHGFEAPSDLRTGGPSAAFQQGMMGISLDDLVTEFGLPVPNAIKIDVDGLEVPILRGAHETLRRKELRTVLIEATDSKNNPEESRQIRHLLEEAGFHVSELGNTLRNQILVSQNIIFVKPNNE